MGAFKPKVKIAVIGAGLIGPRHAATIAQSENASLVAIVDISRTGEHLAAELGVAYYPSIDELLQSTNRPDAAVICTPNDTHASIAKELSSGGIHLVIEKPFCTDIHSGRDLLTHLETTGVKVLVGHHRRFNPYMIATKQIVASGILGDVVAVNGLWVLYKPPDYFGSAAEWRRSKTGGVILINMIHEVDLLQYILGPIIRVHAEKTTSKRGYEAEEGAALTLRFKNGAVGTFFISDNIPSPYNFESGTGENPLIPKAGQDFYRIFGTEASLSVPDMSIWSYNEGMKSWNSEMVKEQQVVADGVPFDFQLTHFCDIIRENETPNCDAKAGFAALVVCQAIKDAVEGNRTIDIDKI